jgi:hypothetical protein
MHSPEPRDPLSDTLATWRLDPPADPGFRAAVWERIRAGSQETWAAYVRGHRLGWATLAVFAIGIAGWAGHTAAEAKLEAGRERMVVHYLGNLDPRVLAKLRP